MTRIERAQAFNKALREQRRAVSDTLPKVAAEAMTLAGGDAAKGRDVASLLTDAVSILEVRDWAVGMTTAPGDLVRSPDKKYVYAFSKDAPMTHANSTFYPGAAGVYYWAIIPNTIDGIPVYPNITGIVVKVKKDQIWYDPTGKTKYRWNSSDWSDCSYPPGSAGVHQWVKV